MALRGIDISFWQSGIDVGSLSADFVICKATEGIGLVDSQCDIAFQKAISAGKLTGVYHFAHPENNAVDEANFFVDNIWGYVGNSILVLDYETNTDVWWAKRWLDQVAARTGVNPMIYLSESAVNSADWQPICHTYGLWVAKYRDYAPDYNYDMTNAGAEPHITDWEFYAMWQWTSSGRLDGYNGNLDCNEFYGDANAWRLYAGAKPVVAPPTPPVVITPDPVPVGPTPIPTVEPVIPMPEPTPVPTPNPTTPLPQLGFWAKVWAWIINYINERFGGK